MQTELMLPPGLDGFPHPAFKMDAPDMAKSECLCFGYIPFWIGSEIGPVAASAIANYWDESAWSWMNNSNIPRCRFCQKQRDLWKRSARGEQIENAVIVPLNWDGEL